MFEETNAVHLVEQFVVEPVVLGWYAWPHLISPATGALNIVNKHIKIMESFIEAPDVHAVACRTPALRGGPFVDLPASEVPAIRKLLEQTKILCSTQMDFARSLREISSRCEKETSGYSLEDLYNDLGDTIDGCIEFYYTDTGSCNFRLIETLLYETNLYMESVQGSHLYIAEGDRREFAFSTPRLGKEVVKIPLPFKHPIYDFLGKMRTSKFKYQDVKSTLSEYNCEPTLLDPYLTTKPIVQRIKTKARWRYFGHACVLVTTAGGSSVLLDPIISGIGPKGSIDRFSFSDLPDKIDYVVITHNHADHVVIETLLALRHCIDCIIVPASSGGLCDPSLKLMLQKLGFNNVISLGTLDSLGNNDLTIRSLPFLGEHGDVDVTTKSSWLIKADGRSYLFAADSNNISPTLYARLHKIVGPVDVLFLGMECIGAPASWVYGPLFMKALGREADQSRRLNGSESERAFKLVEHLKCTEAYVYAMGREPWLSFIMSVDEADDTEQMVQGKLFKKACENKGIKSEILFGQYDS